MRYQNPSVSKSLAFVVLLLTSPPFGLLLHSTSAFIPVPFEDAEINPGCKPFPCPSSPYPLNSTCTNITARTTGPLTNTTTTLTSTYMLTYNLPYSFSVGACQDIISYIRNDLLGCNTVGCSESGSNQTIVLCDLYIPEYCVRESVIEKGEA